MKQDCDVVTNLWLSLKQRLKENIWLDFYWDYIFFIQTESKLFVLEDKHIVITLILDHVFSCLEYVSCLSCLLFVSKLWFDLMSAADWCDDEQIDLSSTNFFNSFMWFCVVGGLCGVKVTCCWLRGKLPPWPCFTTTEWWVCLIMFERISLMSTDVNELGIYLHVLFFIQIVWMQFVRNHLWWSGCGSEDQPLPPDTSGPGWKQPGGFAYEAAQSFPRESRL